MTPFLLSFRDYKFYHTYCGMSSWKIPYLVFKKKRSAYLEEVFDLLFGSLREVFYFIKNYL